MDTNGTEETHAEKSVTQNAEPSLNKEEKGPATETATPTDAETKAQSPDGHRVKVYNLNSEGNWDDCGTGRLQTPRIDETLFLKVLDEEKGMMS